MLSGFHPVPEPAELSFAMASPHIPRTLSWHGCAAIMAFGVDRLALAQERGTSMKLLQSHGEH
jgi:hypothetical protein